MCLFYNKIYVEFTGTYCKCYKNISFFYKYVSLIILLNKKLKYDILVLHKQPVINCDLKGLYIYKVNLYFMDLLMRK